MKDIYLGLVGRHLERLLQRDLCTHPLRGATVVEGGRGILDFGVPETPCFRGIWYMSAMSGLEIGIGQHVPLHRANRMNVFPLVETGEVEVWGNVMVLCVRQTKQIFYSNIPLSEKTLGWLRLKLLRAHVITRRVKAFYTDPSSVSSSSVVFRMTNVYERNRCGTVAYICAYISSRPIHHTLTIESILIGFMPPCYETSR